MPSTYKTKPPASATHARGHIHPAHSESCAVDVVDTSYLQTLRAITTQIVKTAPQYPALAYRVADDYLRAVALVLMDWAWLRIEAGVDDSTPNADTRWKAPAQAMRSWVLPEFQMRTFIIVQQCTAAA